MRKSGFSASVSASLFAISTALAAPAFADQHQSDADKKMEMSKEAKTDKSKQVDRVDAQVNPYKQPDGEWVTLSGKAIDAGPDGFVLDYDGGEVLVEVDDFAGWPDAMPELEGESVSVVGRIDDDLFELTSIEASAVLAPSLGTNLYASAADEEAYFPYQNVNYLAEDDQLAIEGVVSSVNANEGEFDVMIGSYAFQVDTDQLINDPLDDDGFVKIEPYDRVFVSGELDIGVFEDNEIIANEVIKLSS